MNYAYISLRSRGVFKLFWSMVIVLFGLVLMTDFAVAKSIKCGDEVTGNVKLRANLDCSSFPIGSGPILVVAGSAKLDLNGFTLIGNLFTDDQGNTDGDTCIEVTGEGAKVWNGTVTQCVAGVVIAGTGRHKVLKIISIDNENTGFRVEENSNGNRLEKNEALRNQGANFLVERESNDNHLIKNKAEGGYDRGFYVRGSRNRLYKNKAEGNFDDALRIRNGISNKAEHNTFNGTESGEGVEIDSEDNIVRKNVIKQNNRGIRIRKDKNVVKENIIFNNRLEGIRVESSANTISRNIIKNNGYVMSEETGLFRDGLKLEDEAQENILTRNLVFKNIGNGINVDEGAIKNTIEHNIAMENGVDDSYYDAVDGNPKCYENIWCKNHFGTVDPDDCIDGQNCKVGDENDHKYDNDDGLND